MTPKEKANQLVEEFWTEVEDNNYATRKMSLIQAKQCALIAVDEMMKLAIWTEIGVYDYLTEVKKEIEKL